MSQCTAAWLGRAQTLPLLDPLYVITTLIISFIIPFYCSLVVVRSCSDLRFLPLPSHKVAALHPGEKGVLTVPKKEFRSPSYSDSLITDTLSENSAWAIKRFSAEEFQLQNFKERHLTALEALKKSPLDGYDDVLVNEENSANIHFNVASNVGLPLKKRKPRLVDYVTMDHAKDDNHFSSCRCDELNDLQGSISFTGKFNSWTNVQVQVWLWKTLKESKEFSGNTICKTLQKFDEENGFDLTTFTKSQWKEKLADCDEPDAPVRVWEFVWDRVMDRSRDTSLRPHNYSAEPPSREVENLIGSNLHSCYVTGSTLSAPIGNTALTKKVNKPPRRRRDKCVGQLWEFVYNLLQNKDMEHVVRWEDKEKQLFRIVNTEEIARLWGNHKGNGHMTYANMSRTMRYYREGNGAFVRNERKRVYGFGPKANLKRLEAKRKLVNK